MKQFKVVLAIAISFSLFGFGCAQQNDSFSQADKKQLIAKRDFSSPQKTFEYFMRKLQAPDTTPEELLPCIIHSKENIEKTKLLLDYLIANYRFEYRAKLIDKKQPDLVGVSFNLPFNNSMMNLVTNDYSPGDYSFEVNNRICYVKYIKNKNPQQKLVLMEKVNENWLINFAAVKAYDLYVEQMTVMYTTGFAKICGQIYQIKNPHVRKEFTDILNEYILKGETFLLSNLQSKTRYYKYAADAIGFGDLYADDYRAMFKGKMASHSAERNFRLKVQKRLGELKLKYPESYDSWPYLMKEYLNNPPVSK